MGLQATDMDENSSETANLLEAARYGEIEEVQAALDQGCSVDGKGRADVTALHMASANGHCDVVRLLIQQGAMIDARNQDGNTPLHWACLNSQAQVSRVLLEAGANPAAVNSSGSTALDAALQCESSELVELIKSFEPPQPQGNGATAEEP